MLRLIDENVAAEATASENSARIKTGTAKQLALGLVFGILFGVLLQKGGVAKYHVLVGQLLLLDFTVVKVMLSAVAVGMVGVHAMHRLGLVEYHIKPTRYGANIAGGLVFGAGFALSPYCPGTGAAAVGQGNFDALVMVLGMVAGSYLYAEASGFLSWTLLTWGDRGELTLDQVWNVSRSTLVAIAAVAITTLLIAVELTTVR